MFELIIISVSYAPVTSVTSIIIIVAISSVEGLIVFILDISNALQDTIILNIKEMFYLVLPYLYLEIFKRNGQNIH